MDSNARSIQLVTDAAKAHAQGRLSEAEELASQALTLSPTDAQANLLAGVVKVKTGRFEAAIAPLTVATREDPGSFFARYWLSVAYRQTGRLDEAVVAGLESLRLKPDEVQALIAIGSCLLDLGRFQHAGQLFSRAVRLAGGVASAHEGLGIALQGVGRETDAVQELKIASQLDPNSESIGLRLGAALLEQQDLDGAERCARAVLTRRPESGKAEGLLARALMDQGKGLAALEHSEAALRANPADASAEVVQGSVLQNLGRIEEAEISFRKAIQLDPRNGHAYFALIQNRKFTSQDTELLEAMVELEGDTAIPDNRRVHLEYALGKANNDLGHYEAAMGYFDKANEIAQRLRFRDKPYDRKAHERGFDFVRQTLTRDFLERNLSGNASDLPIFVVGMMRSGTTLVEQILSSHSDVGAAGEQRFWPEHHTAVLKPGGHFDRSMADGLGREYVEMLRKLSAKVRFVIDKMPVNYAFLGIIRSALPNARFIHIQRHPVDTCLSIYFTPNRSRIEWAHDKSNIVFAYRQYQKIVSHWADALPADRLLQVRYEDLVQNREATTRTMLDFLGLPWEDAVLRPEQNDRSVLTPSVWQVRQPVYTSSLERWRNYEPWLGAFRELL